MSTRLTYSFKRAFVFGLLGLIGILTINNSLFIHTHTLLNGQTETHAHPFSSSKTHQHSQGELNLLSSLLLLFIAFAPFFTVAKAFVIKKTFICDPNFFNKFQLSALSNRAPPHFFVTP
jgi:hypothetical protein